MDENPINEEINTPPEVAPEVHVEEKPSSEIAEPAPEENSEPIPEPEPIPETDPEEPAPVAEPEAPAPEKPVAEGTAEEPAVNSEPTPETPEEPIAEAEPIAEENPIEPKTIDPTRPDEPIVSEPAPETPIDEPVVPASEPMLSGPEAPKPKSKKPLIAVLAVLLVAILGVGAWLLFKPKTTNNEPEQQQAQNNQAPVTELEPINYTELSLRGNDISNFDLAFLRLENKADNVIYSPLSIKYALAMLADGANGESKAQIRSVLGDYNPKAYLNSKNLSLANALFVRDSFKEKVLPSYISALDSKYKASVVFDPFTNATNLNKWVSDKTLGIIDNFAEDDAVDKLDFMLVNALAIDMNWVNALQCSGVKEENAPPCKSYIYYPSHEEYHDVVGVVDENSKYNRMTFNGRESIFSAQIGASINRYDIIKELGEATIRETVENAYQEEKGEHNLTAETADEYLSRVNKVEEGGLDIFIEELAGNYNQTAISTDFLFLDTENEKVFAKDLQEYDGTTLQYVGIMPKSGNLGAYINNLDAEKVSTLIKNLKDPTNPEDFKDGVLTKIKANIPFFKFDYEMFNLKDNLASLGVTDVFEQTSADLTNIVAEKGEYIEAAMHKADIEFSNYGIRAAASTGFGGMGSAWRWDYKFEVPVEEIDLTFDNPFIFFIRDKNTGEIWFTGTVYEP